MLISVVTVCFNNLVGLKKTIASILAQNGVNLELVVIDGGSKDGTLDYLNNIIDQRLKFISEADNGIFHAMNKGIKMSSGDFISFMNSGDTFYSDNTLFQIFSSVLKPSMYSVIYGNKIFDGATIYPTGIKDEIESGGMFACHQSMLFRNVDLNYNEKLKIYGDYGLLASIFCKNGVTTFKYVDIPVCIYEGSGISNKITFTKRKEKFFLVLKYFGINGLIRSYFLK